MSIVSNTDDMAIVEINNVPVNPMNKLQIITPRTKDTNKTRKTAKSLIVPNNNSTAFLFS